MKSPGQHDSMGTAPKSVTDPAPGPASMADAAYRYLRAGILDGSLPPGGRLQAAMLEKRFGCGLTAIREALIRLGTEGLVATATNRGARVIDVNLDEFHDLMQARQELEVTCLTRAIARATPEWEAAIVAAMHLLSRAALPGSAANHSAAQTWEARHRGFHAALVSATGSAWLLRFWNTLVDQTERYRRVRVLRHSEVAAEVRDADAEHVAIMDAALNRDAERASALMRQHLARSEASISALLRR